MTSISPTTNYIDYCSHYRNNAQAIVPLLENYQGKGLDDIPEEALERGNYMEIMPFIWIERNLQKKATWLKAHELHAPFLFELALCEVELAPTTRTIKLVFCPLIQAGAFRILQDAACIDDPTLNSAIRIMKDIYKCTLDRLKIRKPIQWSNLKTGEKQEALVSKLKEIAKKSLDPLAKLPPPTWLASYGVRAHVGDDVTFPQEHWSEHRNRIAELLLKASESTKFG